MKRLFLMALILGVSLAGVARGAIISNPNGFFFTDGKSVLKLVNYEMEVNNAAIGNVPGLIEPGDSLEGIFIVTSSHKDGDPLNLTFGDGTFELTGHFRGLVNVVTPIGGGQALFELGPDPVFDTAGAGVMLRAYNDSSPDFTPVGTIAASTASAIDGTLYAELGADPTSDWGDLNLDTAGYYWAANGSVIPSVSSFAASLDLITNLTGIPSLNFLAITQTPPFSVPPGFTNQPALSGILNEFGLQGNTVNNTVPGSLWTLSSWDPLRANVVPEPGSIAIWSILGLIGLAAARRRQRRSA